MNEQLQTQKNDTPESLYAEHKEVASQVESAEKARDSALGHLAHIDSRAGDPYSDRLDRSGLMEDLGEYHLRVSERKMKHDDNIARAKAHLQAHPEEYDA